MVWMRESISNEAVVLVNPYEAGLFIPTVSYHRIVYPYTGSQLSYRYQQLVGLLTQITLNATTYELLADLNITHIFFGEYSTYWWDENFKWNPIIFISNPDFKLLKRFGRSYLFELIF